MASDDNADGREGFHFRANDAPSNANPRTRDETTTERECNLKDTNGDGEETTEMNEYVRFSYDFYVVSRQQQGGVIRLQVHTPNRGALCVLGKCRVVSLEVIDLSADVVFIKHPATGKGKVTPATLEPTGRYSSMR